MLGLSSEQHFSTVPLRVTDSKYQESLDRFEKSKTLRLCLKNAFREPSSKILFRFSKNLTSSRNSQNTKIHLFTSLISPWKRIWSTTVRNMPSNHSINRLYVFVDYANKLSPTLKSFKFASTRSDWPDFLFEILKKKTIGLSQCLFRLDIRHTKMRFRLVKIRNFYRFHRSLKRQSFDSRWNPSNYLKKVKLPSVR